MFNLEKHGQVPIEPIEGDITGAFNDLGDQYEGGQGDESAADVIDSVDNDQQEQLLQQAQNLPIWNFFVELGNENPNLLPDIQAVMAQAGIRSLEDTMNPASIQALHQQLVDADLQGTSALLSEAPDVTISKSSILNAAMKARNDRMQNVTQQLPIAAFNLQRIKEAQMENMGASRFPVANVGDFITKFVEDLLAWNGQPGSPGYEAAKLAVEEIRSAVSPGFEEEANSILEDIIQLDPAMERNQAEQGLVKIHNVMLPEMLKDQETQEPEAEMQMPPQEMPMQPMEPVMSQTKPEGIIRYNLTDHILNNPPTTEMVKTAADQFGQQYLLYGPTEKRICPKLRGKNLSVGDVVSEYTCRHHCLDGIAIDDNKTICGEALWRANAMDKYSREYRDEDGNIVGGFLNKRFEINRNVPEETKMQLKPGEIRKPRPASQGNLESRLQDMRNKEGQSRGYRPGPNSGEPFEWCHDPDQNNVGISQAERDKRETASGHQLVQYTNREQGENNPKKLAFNLKTHKTAQRDPYTDVQRPTPGSHDEYSNQSTVNRLTRKKCPDCKDRVCRCGTGDVGDPKTKSAQEAPVKTAELPQPHQVKIPLRDPIHKPSPKDKHQPELNPAAAHARQPADVDPRKQTIDSGKPMKKKRCFNLKQLKTAFSYEGEKFDVNPFAVCNESTGGKNKAGKEKWERCVQKVKSKSRQSMENKETKEAENDYVFHIPGWIKTKEPWEKSKNSGDVLATYTKVDSKKKT